MVSGLGVVEFRASVFFRTLGFPNSAALVLRRLVQAQSSDRDLRGFSNLASFACMGFNLKVLRVLKFLLGLGYGMGDGKLVYPEGLRLKGLSNAVRSLN